MSIAASLGFLALASALCLVGMATLALTQDRNWRRVDTGGSPAGWARPTGWALVIAALAVCIIRDGPSFAALIWPMLAAGAALAVGMVLAYRPQWLSPLCQRLASARAPVTKGRQ